MDKVKILFGKYKDIIPYVFWGICTTIVNVIVYWMCSHLIFLPVMVSTIVAWTVAVLFAYLTNRKWVFYSEAKDWKAILKEIISFFLCRLVTGIVDWFFMFMFVDVLSLNDMLIKITANVVVVILNYVASKMFIFKHASKK